MPENVPAFEVVPPRRIRFGPFELDTRSGELRKHGIKVRLRQQTFQILLMLLKHPGEVVLRDEIRVELWPGDTVVEFEHSINAAVQKLRDALGESADNPKYIETLPRRGYRFIGSIENEAPPEPVVTSEPVTTDKEAEPVVKQPKEQLFPAASSRRRSLAIMGAVAFGGVAALAVVGWIRSSGDPPKATNFTLTLGAISPRPAVVSPDGSAVIYATSQGLVVRRLDSPDETLVYAFERLNDTPSWSPDGSEILIHSVDGLSRMKLPDGKRTIIWPKTHVTRGSSWGPDGLIITATVEQAVGDLYLVRADGGGATRLEVPGMNHGLFFQPEFLPDGANILFAWAGFDEADAGLYLATIRNGSIVRGPFLLRRNTTGGHYSPSGGGRLLYVEDDKLYAQELNVKEGKLEGEPVRIANDVHSAPGVRRASFYVSRNGVLVWKAGRASLAQLTRFDRTGKVLGTAGPLHVADVVRMSPDEKHIIIPSTSETAGYSIVEPNQSGHVVLPGIAKPVWLPDSLNILYSRRDGTGFLVLSRAAAGGVEKELTRIPELDSFRDVSSDGKLLLYRVGSALYTVGLDGSPETAKPRMVALSRDGKLAPDGHWLVYGFNMDASQRSIYVQPFPSGGLRTQIPSKGGLKPVWRADGKEILFLQGSMLYSVEVETKGKVFQAGRPVPLFKVRVPDGLVAESEPIAVTRDGSTIFFAQGVEQPDPQLTYVMTAWDTKLKP